MIIVEKLTVEVDRLDRMWIKFNLERIQFGKYLDETDLDLSWLKKLKD